MTAATVAGGAGAGVVPRLGRLAILFATTLCAACGLVYELALIALGSYLVGNTIHQASVVLSVFIFAMGVGALAAKRLQARPALAFGVVEAALGLVGGLSVLVLYAAFAWIGIYTPAMIAVAFVLGALIGAEIPVLMTLLQRVRTQAAGDAVADLFAADYLGALIGGLAFPFVLLPHFGQLRGAMVVGAINVVVAGALVVGYFGSDLRPRVRWCLTSLLAVVLGVLAVAAAWSDRFEVSARQALYEDPIVESSTSRYQDIVLTRSLRGGDVRLFLNGDLQFSSIDEYRYHEALVHPALAGPRRRVLVLGGGDGLALREVLRYDDVESVTLVELDPEVVALSRREQLVRRLNGGSLDDPRVTVVHADAFSWLRAGASAFDVVIADFPDPEDVATAKLYSVEFYGFVRRHLAPGGRLMVQAGSPYFAADAFWSIEATVRAAGFDATPFHVDVPSFGDWGFVLASVDGPPSLTLPADAPATRFLTPAVVAASTAFPADRGRRPVQPSTLLRPVILDYERAGWGAY